ncbi:MAG TPA: SGNH/GDSL hydrolase family protein [Steroidobacteraceae bacterium]|nr:SGNH/GDSL hydrolase family protein [Steroidobacteraceae bacterium]
MNKSLAAACLVTLLMNALPCGAAEWVATWGVAPLPPSAAFGPFPATPSYHDQTIRQVVRISAGGERVRIRFTNEYGTRPLAIGAAHVALADANGVPQAGTDREILFSGRPSALIPAGAPLLSDPVDLPVKALASLSISLYLPEDTGPCTCHSTGMQTAYVSASGNFTGKAFEPKEKMQSRAFLSGVEVESTRAARTVVAFGDSITDGLGSTVDANRRWPDLLAARLAARGGGVAWGMVNMGISGNRVLDDNAGQNALARFDRDVLSVPGVKYVIVFEGVNDLGISFGDFSGPLAASFKGMAPAHKATAEAIIAGYRQLIARAHSKGLKVFGATITPYEGAAYYSVEGEEQRQAVNRWIRTGGGFDGVLDFDAAWRDPAHPTQIKNGLHAGDHLHGSDAGYEALASSVELGLFR